MTSALSEREILRALTALTKDKSAWPKALPDLLRLLSHDSVKVRAKALWLLGETGLLRPELLAAHVGEVAGFLRSENALLRERALNALGRIGRGDCRLIEPYLNDMRQLARNMGPNVRLAFIWACENIATNAPELFENDLPLFAALLDDENDRVRMEAPEIFRVLGRRNPQSVIPYRAKLLALSERDENRVVRIHAAGAVRAMDKGGDAHAGCFPSAPAISRSPWAQRGRLWIAPQGTAAKYPCIEGVPIRSTSEQIN